MRSLYSGWRFGVSLFGVLVAVASPAAAVAAGGGRGELAWSAPVLVDRAAPEAGGFSLSGVSCPSVRLCVAVEAGKGVLSTRQPGRKDARWRRVVFPQALTSVSCPSVRFCMAGGVRGGLFVSGDPSGGLGAWKAIAARGLYPTCPSDRLCLVEGDLGHAIAGRLKAITRGSAAGSGWHVTRLNVGQYISRVTCPSVHFCAAVDGNDAGSVYTSTDPSRASGWHHHVIGPPGTGLLGLFCPSAHLCVADGGSDVLTSRTPTTGEWSIRRVAGMSAGLDGVWCRSSRLCLAFSQFGQDFVTDNPFGPWHRTNVNGLPVRGVSCPSLSLCVGVTGVGPPTNPVVSGPGGPFVSGFELTTNDPLGGHWTSRRIDPLPRHHRYNGFVAVSCPDSKLCFAVNDAGNLLFSRDPSGGRTAWKAFGIGHLAGLTGISCPSKELCVAFDDRGRVLTSTNPTAGRSAWSVSEINPPGSDEGGSTSISCPSVSFCIALYAGRTFVSSDPAGGASAWHRIPITGVTASCASATLCVIGGGGYVMSSTDPGGGAGAWHSVTIENSYYNGIIGSSCPSTKLCVLINGPDGDVFTSTDPTGPASSWKIQPYVVNDYESTVECAFPTLCIALPLDGPSIYTSTHPTGGRPTWTDATIDRRRALTAISCAPNTTTCVAVDSTGHVTTSH